MCRPKGQRYRRERRPPPTAPTLRDCGSGAWDRRIRRPGREGNQSRSLRAPGGCDPNTSCRTRACSEARRGATWPYYALLVEVQPLTPPKSRSRKLATIFKLTHYRLAFSIAQVLESSSMANVPGPQPDVKFCPRCKAALRNVPRSEMKSRAYKRRDGTVSPDTHTYECLNCKARFEINQDQ